MGAVIFCLLPSLSSFLFLWLISEGRAREGYV
jgi:hypothetical protein